MGVANVAPFAWKFFSQMILERPENILVSPLSIAACLSMIWSGVTRSSQTDAEFQSLFQLPSEHSIPTLVNVLLKKENKNNDNSNQMLSMSKSLWTKAVVDSKYVEQVSSFASIQPLPTFYDPINRWVAKETNNHIPKLFSSEDPLDPNAIAIAVNAIHFQGLWATPFESTHTQPGTFTTFDDQETYTANFMSKTIHTSLAWDVSSLGGATVLTMDYAFPDAQQQQQGFFEDSEFYAMLVLPKHNTVQSMKRVIQGFTKQVSDSSNNNNNKSSSDLYFSDDFHKQNVHVSLPRFELKQGPESLKEFFKGMGFQTAFSTEKNQFLRMTPNRGDTYLDDVMAAATMKVTEEGTVATAATGAIMMTRSLPPSVEFNRPFLFMVLHRPTRTPLFLSQVHNPNFL